MIGVSTLVATPDTATLVTRTEPSAMSASTSRSLPMRKLGCSRSGSSKIAISAERMPESHPRPE